MSDTEVFSAQTPSDLPPGDYFGILIREKIDALGWKLLVYPSRASWEQELQRLLTAGTNFVPALLRRPEVSLVTTVKLSFTGAL